MKNQSSSGLEDYGFGSLTLKAFDPQYSYSRIQNTKQDLPITKQRYTTNSSYELCMTRHVFVMATCPGHLCCQGWHSCGVAEVTMPERHPYHSVCSFLLVLLLSSASF